MAKRIFGDVCDMKERPTYLPIELAERLPWLTGSQRKEINGKLIRVSSSKDVRLVQILKLLFALYREDKLFTQLYYDSCIRLKMSFLNNLNFALAMNFITKLVPEKKQTQPYGITKKGRLFLEMFLK